MNHWRLERWADGRGVDVVGSLRPTNGKSPFAMGDAVLGRPDSETRLIVRSWSGGRTPRWADGDEIDSETWGTLVGSAQASNMLRYVPAVGGVEVWLLRRTFPRRASLIKLLRERRAIVGAERDGEAVRVVTRWSLAKSVRADFSREIVDVDPWCAFCMWPTEAVAQRAIDRLGSEYDGLKNWLRSYLASRG